VSRSADRERALEIAEQLRALGRPEVSAFFGGAGIRVNAIQLGFVIHGTAYFRVSDLSRPKYQSHGSVPFSYAGRGKRVTVASYYQVPDSVIEDRDALREWAAAAYQAVLARATPTPRRARPAGR
jgi:DNA transformation protein and related proteins